MGQATYEQFLWRGHLGKECVITVSMRIASHDVRHGISSLACVPAKHARNSTDGIDADWPQMHCTEPKYRGALGLVGGDPIRKPETVLKQESQLAPYWDETML